MHPMKPGGAGRKGARSRTDATAGSPGTGRPGSVKSPASGLFDGSGPDPGRRATLIGVLIVGLAALLPRLWHLAEFANLPFFHALQMDARFHADWAGRLVADDWNDPQVFFRAPFYPYALAALWSLTGDLLWTARLVQIAAGVATVILSYRIAARLLPPRWALAAGIMAALSWVPVHYETELLLEPLLTLLTTLLIFLMVRAPRRTPAAVTLLGWGALAGLAAVTRPNVLVFLPALPLYAWWLESATLRGRVPPRRLLRSALLVLAGFVLPILPVWMHNARHGDPSTVIAWQGGINLYIGNNAEANGWSAIAPGMRTDWRGSYEDAIRLAQERSGSDRALRPSEVSAFWTREAGKFWRVEPARALALTSLKAILFWSAPEIRNNEDPRFYRSRLASLRALPFSFALLAPLALLGLGLALAAGARWRLLGGFVLAWFLSILPFFVCARYRLPVTPLLPLFAVVALRWGAAAWKKRRLVALGAGIAGLVGLHLLLFPARARVHDGGFFQSWNNLGDAWSDLKAWPAATEAYRQALSENPLYPNSYNNLAVALERMGRLDEAERAYRDGLRAIPGHPALRRNLAILLDARGRPAEAETELLALLRDQPADWQAAILLARIRDAAGRTGEARAILESVLSARPEIVPARLHLAQVLRRSGEGAAARRLLEEGVRLTPANPDLRRALAAPESGV